MFTEYNFENYRVYQKKFASLSDLNLFLLSNPPVNTPVFGDPRRIHSVHYEKCGLPYDDCVRWLLSGYDRALPEILRIDSSIEGTTFDESSERIYKKSPVGSRPNVVNYIAGSPLTMYKREKYEDLQVVNILFNIQASWRTSQSQIYHRGVITYELIRLLESKGYSVNLNVFCASVSGNEMIYYEIGIKPLESQFILTEANTFVLFAPEMFRRIIFRLMESTPVKNTEWSGNYGTTVDENVLKRFLNLDSSSFLISNPREMGIEGDNLEKDAQAFLEKLNIRGKVDVEQETIDLIFKPKKM